jgi:hypothetical protein
MVAFTLMEERIRQLLRAMHGSNEFRLISQKWDGTTVPIHHLGRTKSLR